MTTPRYPISDKDILELLNKYPFLRHHDAVTGKPIYYGKSKDLEYNYYKYWDGNGWEYLWKYKYLPRLFKEYDSWTESDKNQFRFLQVKEKYGSLRIYCSGYSNKNLESIAESLSSYTCEYCGTEPRDEHGTRIIWRTTDGWITNLCKKCAAADLRANNVPEDKIEEELDKMKRVCQGFGYRQYGKKRIEVIYKETPDGWLEIDTEKEFDPEEKTN